MLLVTIHGQLELSGKPSKFDVLVLVGLSQYVSRNGCYGCNSCQHRENNCDLEYSSQDWVYCNHPKVSVSARSNLKTFPFKTAPLDCFDVGPWCLPYACIDGWYEDIPTVGRHHAGGLLTRAANKHGLIKLSERNEKRTAEALEKFCKDTGFDLDKFCSDYC